MQTEVTENVSISLTWNSRLISHFVGNSVALQIVAITSFSVTHFPTSAILVFIVKC